MTLSSFRLLTGAGPSFYIEESDDLNRRMRQYRTPVQKQQTNMRLNQLLPNQLNSGGCVTLAACYSGRVRMDTDTEETFDLNLYRKYDRRLLESATIILTEHAGERVENF
jgi:hypothetical protein